MGDSCYKLNLKDQLRIQNFVKFSPEQVKVDKDPRTLVTVKFS